MSRRCPMCKHTHYDDAKFKNMVSVEDSEIKDSTLVKYYSLLLIPTLPTAAGLTAMAFTESTWFWLFASFAYGVTSLSATGFVMAEHKDRLFKRFGG